MRSAPQERCCFERPISRLDPKKASESGWAPENCAAGPSAFGLPVRKIRTIKYDKSNKSWQPSLSAPVPDSLLQQASLSRRRHLDYSTIG